MVIVLCQMKVLKSKATSCLSTFLYHNQSFKDIFMFFYYAKTVAVAYNQQVVEVDNIMSHVAHDNHFLNLTLKDIENYVLFPYHLSAVFVKTPCFCQLVKHFY